MSRFKKQAKNINNKFLLETLPFWLRKLKKNNPKLCNCKKKLYNFFLVKNYEKICS